MTQDIIAFARQGALRDTLQKGCRVEITGHNWDIGEVTQTGEVVRVNGGQVTVRVDDGHILWIRLCDCRPVTGDAP